MAKGIRMPILESALTSSFKQLRNIGRVLLIYNGVSLIVFLAVWIIGSKYIDDFGLITRDPAQLYNYNPLIGIVSHIGIFLWCSTAAICFFVYFLLRNQGDKGIRSFLLSSAFLTAYLLLDDIFLIHEILGPKYLHIKQNHFYGFYFLIFLLYHVIFIRVILKTEFLLLFLAFAYFGISIIIDYLGSKFGVEINTLVEDAFKLIGILSWFLYFGRTGLKAVRSQSVE